MSLRQDGRTFRALAWNAVERERCSPGTGGAVEIAFSLETERVQRQYLRRRGEDFGRRLVSARRPGLTAGALRGQVGYPPTSGVGR